ncbi:hypothetical protein KSP39_PZI021777 [Platanthera zijinensis]|uniref:Uncharacterized protein n=1 Tax=Platanthera zijinensis TaxID=2320716 RepID=A0AAP0AWR7_9ASPA
METTIVLSKNVPWGEHHMIDLSSREGGHSGYKQRFLAILAQGTGKQGHVASEPLAFITLPKMCVNKQRSSKLAYIKEQV